MAEARLIDGNNMNFQDGYVVDEYADIEKKVPKNALMGTYVLVISTSQVYMKNSQGEQKEI